MYKNSSHWRKDSGELDVFEASRYFSAANDHIPAGRHVSKQRRSLDMPMMRSNPIPPEYHHIMIMDHHHQNQAIEKKKFKQPSSPGGRLASFLNSLFNQSHLKKKKKTKTGPATRDFDDETPGGGGGGGGGGRRKRRSSISHFLSSSDKKTSNSGFRTPPPYANTPIKSYKINTDDHDQDISGPKNGKNYKITLLDELHAERNVRDYAWVSDKMLKNSNFGFSSDGINLNQPEEKLREEDEGADSDSSSDLFDLPNHALDFLSSGLPVYGTTHMDRITNF
ncbi:hypothetical protein ACS0TY_008187 [Phlomoides rotata]